MASSPTALSHPIPLRTADSPTIDLRHPTPDLQSLQGAYIGNIERLEERAERMSVSGSDIGEEIRKLQQEQKQSDSRRSSLRSTPAEEARLFSNRSRNASTSSYTRSIVDVNSTARWGGYSPGGYVTSPVGSLRSGSFPHPPLQRQRSGSRTSRLGQMVHAEDADNSLQDGAAHPGSPQSHRSVPRSVPREAASPPASHRSVSSFTRQYDRIAQEIQDELEQNMTHDEHSDGVQSQHQERYYAGHSDSQGPHDPHDRPPTAASTDTTHQARMLWQDFDGVHCPDTVPEEEPSPRGSGRGSRCSSMLKVPAELPAAGAPPPADNMVFYPAPVPRMLNLPKRLSQMPAATVQARRRTQLLESMEAENRKSAAWLPDAGAEGAKQKQSRKSRQSRQSLAGLPNAASLPPQLRASAYFDLVAPAQEFEVKGESAQDTLESILDASAHAPVSAFTDHPFAGRLGSQVYAPEQRRKSKAVDMDQADARKSRSSINLLDTRRNSSGDPLNKLRKRNSSGDLDLLTVRASTSRMSLADELDEPSVDDRGPEEGDERAPTAHALEGDPAANSEDEGGEEDKDDDDDDEEEEEQPQEYQNFGPPTTLLAELQMRKAQQKSRNLTAATAFPNGMHSTLLQLDAVAEIEKNRRKGQKVNLAWEAAPPTRPDDEDSDDDVPLGILFPGREGLVNKKPGAGAQHGSDWDRPVGLIAQRELEDSEPLSKRRTRLLGADPYKPMRRAPPAEASQSHQHFAVPTTTTPQPESEEEEEGETLAERIRRLKDRQALDNALGADVRKSTVSGDFAAEMMSQFGVPADEDKDEKPKATPSPGPEDETLGQRRARLQAEALARGDAPPQNTRRPPLRASLSMADILSAHPIDNTNSARKVSDEALAASLPQGSLLQQNELRQSRLKADRLEQNHRMSSYGSMNKPLLGDDLKKMAPEQAIDAKIEAYKKNWGGIPAQPMPSMLRASMMGAGMLPSMSAMNLPQQNMGMGMGMPMGMGGMHSMNGFGASSSNMMPQQMMAMSMGLNMGMPTNGMQGMTYPYPQMGGMGGMQHSSMVNVPNQLQQSMAIDQPMDPRQRALIDRWRQQIMQ